jgi:hypothetical protein
MPNEWCGRQNQPLSGSSCSPTALSVCDIRQSSVGVAQEKGQLPPKHTGKVFLAASLPPFIVYFWNYPVERKGMDQHPSRGISDDVVKTLLPWIKGTKSLDLKIK